MKKVRNLFAMFIAMIMALVLSVPVFAAESNYTITINNSTKDHTYEAYQVFAGDLSDGVLSNITWGDGVSGDTLLTALKGDKTIGSTFTGCENGADVAAKLTSDNGFAYDSDKMKTFADIVGQNLTMTTSGTCDDGMASGDSYTYKISGVAAGYYLIQDKDPAEGSSIDAYTRYILKVVENTTVTPKSDVPSVEKKVQEDDKYNRDGGYGKGYNDVADWNIGDSVPFKLIGTLPSTLADYDSYKYVFHDTLSNGLTYNKDAKVYVVNGKTRTEVTDQFDINSSGTSLTISCGDITKLTGVSVTASSKIVVEYTATLNTNAVIGLDGNPNEVYLEFSNNPNKGGEGDTGTTPPDKVIVFTYELDTTKVGGSNDTDKPKLKDAQFVLLNKAEDKVAKVNAETNRFESWIDLPEDTSYEDWTKYNETNHVILTSDNDGQFKVIGLDDGTYQLREIKAPDGYNLPNGDFAIIITATTANGQEWTSGKASDALTKLEVTANGQPGTGNINSGIAGVTIENNKGATLPVTGGIGTTIFYIIGGILVVGAGVLLITRKRMSANNNEQ